MEGVLSRPEPSHQTPRNKVTSFFKDAGVRYERHLINRRHGSTKRFISEYVRKVQKKDQEIDQLMGNASVENESLLLPADEYLDAEFITFLERMGKSEKPQDQQKRLEQMRDYSCTAVRELRRYGQSDLENQAQLLYAARRIILKAVEITGRYDSQPIDKVWLNDLTRNVLDLSQGAKLEEHLSLFAKNPPREPLK